MGEDSEEGNGGADVEAVGGGRGCRSRSLEVEKRERKPLTEALGEGSRFNLRSWRRSIRPWACAFDGRDCAAVDARGADVVERVAGRGRERGVVVVDGWWCGVGGGVKQALSERTNEASGTMRLTDNVT